jgi:hypothetical protein
MTATTVSITRGRYSTDAVEGLSGSPTVIFTRPANTTPYGIADVVGSASTANHEATLVGSPGSLIQIQSASLLINNTSVPSGMGNFRLHLWNAAPAAIADNAVFAASAADRAKYCGFVDLASIAAIGGGFLFTSGDYVGRPIRLSTSSFWFNLVTNAAYTPSSGTEYQVRFHGVEVGS